MNPKTTVKVIKFGDIDEAIHKGNENAIAAIVTKVTAQAKALAPVDLGQLHGSIMGKTSQGSSGHEQGPVLGADPKEGEGYVGTAVLYGIYQEFGTRNTKAQPYLRPAIELEANGSSVAQIVKKYGNDAMKKRGKRRIEKRV